GPVRNIFYPAITPKNSSKTLSIGQLGKFDINAIEKNHRKHIRLHALSYPGTFRTLDVHDRNVSQADATGHDALHQAQLCYLPEKLHPMSLHCLDILREKTKIKWSEELWNLIDMPVLDPTLNILNDDIPSDDKANARTYAADQALSDAQC